MSFLTVREVCDRLRLSKPDSVLSSIKLGDLPAVDVSGSPGRPTWRIRESDFEAWLERRRAVPPAPTPTRRTRARKLAGGVTQYF
jgi:excisionase family DNA binding protein